MKKFTTCFFLAAVCALLFLCGCKKKSSSELPAASSELMIRFFASMRRGDHASAVQQGVKLYALDNSQDSVIQLVMLEQANQKAKLTASTLTQPDDDYLKRIAIKSTIPGVQIALGNFTLAFNNTALRKTIVNVANTNATSPEINGKLETNVKYLLVGSKYLYLRTKPNTLNPTNKPPQT